MLFLVVGCSVKTTETPTTLAPTTVAPTTVAPTTQALTTTPVELLVQESTVQSGYLTAEVQDGTILHAWNWSMSEIEAHLEEIAIAGFSTVQISPMQPQKDFFGIATWGSAWWKLYQPLAFSIATENHSLGTKTDLISLT